MNKVILIGRLTRDPELRTIASGNATTSFTVAVNRNFTNQNGEREADFINCVAWRKQAENVAKYCTKGSQVAVEGRIQTRNYDAQDGTKRYVTEVIADNVQFLDTKASRENMNNNTGFNNTPSDMSPSSFSDQPSNSVDVKSDPFADFGSSIEINDDELPF